MDIEILAEQFYDYSGFIRGYSKATIRRYKYVINVYRRHAGVKSINEVTDENIRSLFLWGRTHRSWKPNTYIVFYKSLKVFFRWCVEQGIITSNPVQEIELPKLEKQMPRNLTQQNALRLLEVVYNYPYQHNYLRCRNHAIFSTFLFAGLRKNELLHLKLTDVDIENLTIFVRQGKGNKDRIIPVSYTLAQSLKRYLTERSKLKKTCPEFFASFNRNQGFTESGIKLLVEKIKKTSGISFSIHKLRHTFATLMLEGGCDIYSLSRMMGHNDIQVTTIYLSASAALLRGQIIKHPLNSLEQNGTKN